MNALRRAAVALHALNAEDRAWMLAALPAAQRPHVQAHLDELDELGFVVDAGTERALAVPQVAPLSAKERIRRADAAQLGAVLAEAPPALVAQLLKVEAWPWEEALLAGLDGLYRQQVRVAIAAVLPGPERDAVLVELVAARLAEQVPVARVPVVAPAGWHARAAQAWSRLQSAWRK